MICLVYALKEWSCILSEIMWIKHKVRNCTAKPRTLVVGDLQATLFGSLVWHSPIIFYCWLHHELLSKRQSSRLTATTIANTGFLSKLLHLFIQVCVCTQIHTLATTDLWTSEDSLLGGLVISFHVCSRDPSQITRLLSKHFYLLIHVVGPWW